MSLVALLRPDERKELYKKQRSEIIMPKDLIKIDVNSENKFKVIKSCQIVNVEGLYVVGLVLSGAIISGMFADFNGKTVEITEVESNLGDIAKQGMKAGIVVKGLEKQELDSRQKEQIEMNFKLPAGQ